MESALIKEATDILKRLSPQNQAYFITLARVAEAAENAVKNTQHEQEQAASPQGRPAGTPAGMQKQKSAR